MPFSLTLSDPIRGIGTAYIARSMKNGPLTQGQGPFVPWLRDRDSNPDRLIQSQLSYH